jgi:hypothetical protein
VADLPAPNNNIVAMARKYFISKWFYSASFFLIVAP